MDDREKFNNYLKGPSNDTVNTSTVIDSVPAEEMTIDDLLSIIVDDLLMRESDLFEARRRIVKLCNERKMDITTMKNVLDSLNNTTTSIRSLQNDTLLFLYSHHMFGGKIHAK